MSGPLSGEKEQPGLNREVENQDQQAEVAAARAGGYRLLARFFTREVDEPLLAFLRENPDFLPGVKLPGAEEQAGWLHSLNVEYSRLLLLNVYPYASIYTGREMLLNTEETDRVRRFYTLYGFDHSTFGTGGGNLLPDHLAVELSFLAFLGEEESESWRKNNPARAEFLASVEQTFLTEFLLSWLPVFAVALKRSGTSGFYGAVAEQCLSFACQDFEYLSNLPTPAPGETPSQWEASPGPSAASGLEESLPASLKQLIRFLLTPVEAGFYLSKLELFKLGQVLELPVGVTERYKMLENLFSNAAEYGQVENLMEALNIIRESYQEELTRFQQEWPLNEAVWQAWQQRLENTFFFLKAVKKEVGKEAGEMLEPAVDLEMERGRKSFT
ncbi:MAG TPA: molecular chaperone TorD family protein [Chloroflexia bacterium]|nr:molecular chaperone TorD family protein [Chloroflexia bacterium]